tara:strand:+ start:4927 stop:5412 length:486 start_codon:yes stop_codon:yes gene_type:complete
MSVVADEPDVKSLDAFKSFLMSKGLRVTQPRLAILKAAFVLPEHYTAEELLAQACQIDDSVSRATLYRTLPLLIECGTVREIDVGKECKYYKCCDTIKPFQAQVVCSDCDKIFEIDAPFMEWYGKTVSERLGLEVGSQRLQVTARCPKSEAGECIKTTCDN